MTRSSESRSNRSVVRPPRPSRAHPVSHEGPVAPANFHTAEAPYDPPVELIELGCLSDEQYATLVGDEEDPWEAAEFGLEWRPKDHHVAIRDDDGRLLAAAGLVLVEVQVGATPPIPVVGVGGVIVTASYRGRGLGRRVITEALRRAEGMGPEIVMLFCRAEIVALYRRHGFAEVPGPVFVDQPDGIAEISGAGRTMWRPLKDGARLPDGIVKVVGLPF
jgi:predicted GNAT family N-acyltransferase